MKLYTTRTIYNMESCELLFSLLFGNVIHHFRNGATYVWHVFCFYFLYLIQFSVFLFFALCLSFDTHARTPYHISTTKYRTSIAYIFWRRENTHTRRINNKQLKMLENRWKHMHFCCKRFRKISLVPGRTLKYRFVSLCAAQNIHAM